MILIYICQIVIMCILAMLIFIYVQPAPKRDDFVDEFFYELAKSNYEYDQKKSLSGIEFMLALVVMLFLVPFIF